MAKGFDCATPLTAETAAAFAGSGYVFVARYLVPSEWKRLTKEEADAITQYGLQIVSVFETTADRALGGREAGLADGATAAQLAQEIGQPVGTAIYFTVDFDAAAEQMQTVIDYIGAAGEATPDYNTGVYGSYDVIEAVRASGACSKFWQTYSWSSGEESNGINIYQYQNDTTVNGISVDLDESFGNEGWWNTKMISVSDANKMIGLLQEAYRQGVTKITLPDGTVVTVDDNELHRLANVQRVASGQPEE